MKGSKKLGIAAYVMSIVYWFLFLKWHHHVEENVVHFSCIIWVVYAIIFMLSNAFFSADFWIQNDLDDDWDDIKDHHHWIIYTGLFGFPVWYILKLADKYLSD